LWQANESLGRPALHAKDDCGFGAASKPVAEAVQSDTSHVDSHSFPESSTLVILPHAPQTSGASLDYSLILVAEEERML
jgi:hypothetical protein